MSIKASIEITSVEELKALTETKVIEVPKIVYKERIKKIEIPKIVYKESDPSLIAKKVNEELGKVLQENSKNTKHICLICGIDNIDVEPFGPPIPFTGLDGYEYQVINKNCKQCGNYLTIQKD